MNNLNPSFTRQNAGEFEAGLKRFNDSHDN
jgi:hypothetical protein